SARSGGCAPRCKSIWPIGGFASSALRIGYPTIRCSAVPGTSAFARAMRYAGYLRAWWRSALRLGWLVIRADVDKKKRTPGDQPVSWPKAEEASRAVREYLMALDAAQNHAESSEDDDKFDGGARRKPRRHWLRGRTHRSFFRL